MAKREKQGNGAKVPVRATEQRLPAQPAWRTEYPLHWLRDEIGTLFERFFGRWPAAWEPGWASERFRDVDVEEMDKEIVVRTEAPGFEPQDFDIHVSGNTLTIRAEHKEEEKEEREGYRYAERRFGRFQRSIALSTAVDADKVEARYLSGVWRCACPGPSRAKGGASRSNRRNR